MIRFHFGQYPDGMPDDDRERLDAVTDETMRSQLAEIWIAARDHDQRLDAGDARAWAFERRIEKAKLEAEQARLKGQYEQAISGAMGPVAQDLAKHCASQMQHGASEAALHRDFDTAWRAERRGNGSRQPGLKGVA